MGRDSWCCLEDGCCVSHAPRRGITYGYIVGLPVPSLKLPDHVVRHSRWPEQQDMPNDALQSPSTGSSSHTSSGA